MPTADKDNIKPTNNSKDVAALLTALRSDNSLPVEDLSNLASMADDTQRVSNMTRPAVKPPSRSVLTDRCEAPIFHLIWSNSSSTKGNKPVNQRTTAAHASHERLLSRGLTQSADLKVT